MTTDDDRLRAESLEIENLLGEIEQLVTAPAWERIQRVIARIVRLHGAGLAHALAHARSAGASSAFDELVGSDDLLASLLLLHGLHPQSTAERVRRAVDKARAELGIEADALVLVSVEDGRVELHATRNLGGGAMAARVAEAAIRRAIETVAPEIVAVEIRGTPPARDPSLVQLRVRREVP